MNGFMLYADMLQAGHVLRKSAEIAEKDPHGAIITVVSVAVVFTVLLILYLAYTLIGKAIAGGFRRRDSHARAEKKAAPGKEEAAAIAMALDRELNGETYAAIAAALHNYLNDTVHDEESYIITIRRK